MMQESVIKPHVYVPGPLANGQPICRWCTAKPDHPGHALHDGREGEPGDHAPGSKPESCQTCFEEAPSSVSQGLRGHNGWVNRDTWVVNLWLSNDEPAYHEARRIAASDVTPALKCRRLARLARAIAGDPYNRMRVDWGAILEAFSEE